MDLRPYKNAITAWRSNGLRFFRCRATTLTGASSTSRSGPSRAIIIMLIEPNCLHRTAFFELDHSTLALALSSEGCNSARLAGYLKLRACHKLKHRAAIAPFQIMLIAPPCLKCPPLFDYFRADVTTQPPSMMMDVPIERCATSDGALWTHRRDHWLRWHTAA